MAQIVDVQHVVSITAEQQSFCAGAGRRPGLQQGKDISGGVDAQNDHRAGAVITSRQGYDKVQAYPSAGVAVGPDPAGLLGRGRLARRGQKRRVEFEVILRRVP